MLDELITGKAMTVAKVSVKAVCSNCRSYNGNIRAFRQMQFAVCHDLTFSPAVSE